MALKLELSTDQKEALAFIIRNRYSILALEMGMGKTACGIALKDHFPNSKCLVVCPAYLIYTWKKEIEKSLDGQIVTIFKDGKSVYYPVDSDFVIVSYDIAKKSECLFEWCDILILDEAPELKEMTSQRSEAIHRMVYENSIKRVVLMSGTPIKNRIKEFYSLMALCFYNPKIAGGRFLKKFANDIDFADYFSHKRQYTIEKNWRWITITKWEGIKNEKELKDWLKNIYFSRRSKMDKINFKPVLIGDFDDSELRSEFEDYQNGVSKVSPQVKVKAALKKTPYTFSYVSKMIDSGEIEGPVLIYTDHVEPCHELGKLFGFPSITGEMPVKERQKIADDFQAGKLKGICATFGSFSQGYTLTRSNFIAINDYPWSPGSIEQAKFRINRIGQTRPCHVHGIFGSEQDEYIFEAIMEKKEVIDKVF